MGDNRPHALFSPSKLTMLAICPHFVSSNNVSEVAERGIDIHGRIIEAFVEGYILEGAEEETLQTIREIYLTYPFKAYKSEYYIQTSIPHVAGYADLVFFGENIAMVIELKTGWGDRGYCKDSLQIHALVLGLLEQGYEIVTAWLLEVDQKRGTSHSWTQIDIPMLKSNIISCVSTALQPTQYKAGGHCSYCAKMVICPEQSQMLIETYKSVIAEVQNLPPAVVAEKLNDHYEKAMLIEKYINALKARAIAIIEAGGEVEGWTVRYSGGSRSWIDEAEATWQLSELYPEAKLTELMSPAKVEETLKEFAKPKQIRELLSGLTKQTIKKHLEKRKD